MWLTGRLAPDFKTIADFRRDNSKAIRSVCRQFVVLCRNLNLFSQSIITIEGSKFKAVNNRDRNFSVEVAGEWARTMKAAKASYKEALQLKLAQRRAEKNRRAA